MELTAADIANTALLLRNAATGGILVVEGMPDSRLLDRVLSQESRRVVAGSKHMVVAALDRIDDPATHGVLGVVDRDFDEAIGRAIPRHSIAWDETDLEMTVVFSDAFEILMDEVCSLEKVRAFIEGMGAQDLRQALITRAAPLGALRAVSARDGHDLPFRKVRWDRCIASRDLRFDIGRVVRTALQEKTGSQQGADAILSEVEALLASTPDHRRLARGHDVCRLIGVGLESCLGTHGNRAPGGEVIEGALLSAFTPAMFARTAVYQELVAWEQSTGFEVT